MFSVAYVDIDGVIEENQERERHANEIVEALTAPLQPFLDKKQLEDIKRSIFYCKTVFYDERYLLGDTLIARANIYLDSLAARYDRTILITSRPEYTRRVTLESLRRYGIEYDLVMKPLAAQFFKTVSWKVSTIDTLSTFLQADIVALVDNEEEIRKEALRQLEKRFSIMVYASLVEACKA